MKEEHPIDSPYSMDETNPQPLSNCSTPASITPNISPAAAAAAIATVTDSASIIRDNSISPNLSTENLPKLRLNTILAADPALQPEAKDIKRIRTSNTDKYNIQINCDADDNDDYRARYKMMTDDDDDDEDGDDVQMDEDPPQSPHQHTRNRHRGIGGGGGGDDARSTTSSGGHNPRDDRLEATSTVASMAVDALPRIPAFICAPCGIKFSSLSTLEAHQTYYCSHR